MELTGTHQCLSTIGDDEFGQEMFDVTFGGVEADHQMVRNLLVGKAPGNQLKHFLLTGTQRIW